MQAVFVDRRCIRATPMRRAGIGKSAGVRPAPNHVRKLIARQTGTARTRGQARARHPGGRTRLGAPQASVERRRGAVVQRQLAVAHLRTGRYKLWLSSAIVTALEGHGRVLLHIYAR